MINYFGTDLREAGHYFRELEKSGGIDYRHSIDMKQVPFYPYDYPKKQDGFVGFYNEKGYSILAILASCIDTRPNCHSIFFFKGYMTKEEFIKELKNYQYGTNIIKTIEDKYPHITVF